MTKEAWFEVQSVSKTFTNRKKVSLFRYETRRKEAVCDVSFRMEQGEMVGLVGPNGAGKSTLLHMLSGLLLPDCGTIRVGGLEPGRDRKRYVMQIGVLLAGKSQIPRGLCAVDALEWNSRFYRMDRTEFRRRLAYFAELLELEEALDKERQELSLGELMKLELVNVFLHEPQIVFLDEPTIGVDVTAKETIRSFLRQMNETGRLTMILTSHDAGDIENVCNRVLTLDRGRLIREVR